MKKRLFILSAAMLILSGCATIFTGTEDMIYFDTNPQGAEIFIDGLKVCVTPCSSLVKRSLSDKQFEVKLDEYETRVITLDREFNTVSIINLGFVFGWAIDAATGSLMRYDRKGYDLDLRRSNRASLHHPDRIEINTKEKFVDVYQIQEYAE